MAARRFGSNEMRIADTKQKLTDLKDKPPLGFGNVFSRAVQLVKPVTVEELEAAQKVRPQ